MKTIALIGGGPAALMLAAQIDVTKYHVTLFEKNKALARKFLVAGEGGLNLTYSTGMTDLINQYVPSGFIAPIIHQFSNEDLIKWLHEIGVATYIGSSNRVFPERGIKPIEVLNKIVAHVTSRDNIEIRLNSKWLGWSEDGHLVIEGEQSEPHDIIIFALGGASWKVTGSDGSWGEIFTSKGVQVAPFRAANCAFEVMWRPKFINTHAGKPLKNISLTYQDTTAKGELVITKFGLEGNALYALSQLIQDDLQPNGSTTLQLDLKPMLKLEQIEYKIRNSKQTKTTEILKRDLHLSPTAIGLIKHCTDKESFNEQSRLARSIKSLPITVHAANDIDKAISTLGGIDLNEVDDQLMLYALPNTYVIGEMLDWYAPTGGYLLQGCFSMGYALAKYLNEK